MRVKDQKAIARRKCERKREAKQAGVPVVVCNLRRVWWRSLLTGLVRHGSPISARSANAAVSDLNFRYRGQLTHWSQPA